jgi:hypothetical protein
MERTLRQAYNQRFTQEKYEAFKKYMRERYNHEAKFRLCETPVFIGDDIKSKLLEACEEINEVICRPDFKSMTHEAIMNSPLKVPNEDAHPHFVQMDFGICKMDNGEIMPQLIEIQGFPSLYFFQDLLYKAYKECFDLPDDLGAHFDGLNSASYIELLRKVIVAEEDPKHVVLLEIEPQKQATSIDFYVAEAELGIKVLCITDMKKRGKALYYLDESGSEVPIKRIFNRIIFDELTQRNDLKREFYFKDEVDVVWVGHPNWFFRISKFTMPMLSGKYVPDCFYLDKLTEYPQDLDNYVLKPLYSFAGMGVNLHINKDILDQITDRENYILQRKVHYEPIIETPSGPAKFEIRMLMLWEDGHKAPRVINNLIRVSKGEMVGVRYNKDKDWVGASVGFFKK